MSHDNCDVCYETYQRFAGSCIEPDILPIHIDIRRLNENKKSEAKQRLLRSFERHVSAIRNSSGGCLLIHLKGQQKGDVYLGKFDEAFDTSLKSLIPDDKLFTDTYERKWLWSYTGFESCNDFVVLTICKSDCVSTVDYNTKVSTDHQIERSSGLNLHHILLKKEDDSTAEPKILGIPKNLNELYENRSVQLKAFYGETEQSAENLADYIWKRLRFQEYLSCMPKVRAGGSVFIGIEEKKTNSTKTIQVKGFELKVQPEDLKRCLEEKVQNIVVLGTDLQFIEGTKLRKLYKIEFHPVPHEPKHTVIELAVRYVAGVLFYGKGPEAYETIDRGRQGIRKMERRKWLQKFKFDF